MEIGREGEKKESQSGDFLNERARGREHDHAKGYSFLEYGTLYRRISRDEELFNSMEGRRGIYLEYA